MKNSSIIYALLGFLAVLLLFKGVRNKPTTEETNSDNSLEPDTELEVSNIPDIPDGKPDNIQKTLRFGAQFYAV